VPLIKALSKKTGVASILAGDAFIVSSGSVDTSGGLLKWDISLQAKKINAMNKYFMFVLLKVGMVNLFDGTKRTITNRSARKVVYTPKAINK
jgi:hypothetical protein